MASALRAILAQRLVRRVCQHCKQPYQPDELEHEVVLSARELGIERLERLAGRQEVEPLKSERLWDPFQIDVLDLLHDLNQAGRTRVMVLHDLNQACRYAHNLVAMRDGSIWGQGDPATVMTKRMVAEVFRLNARIIADPITGTPMCIPLGRTHAVRQHVQPQTAHAPGAIFAPAAIDLIGSGATL